jgi:hypothetical protein
VLLICLSLSLIGIAAGQVSLLFGQRILWEAARMTVLKQLAYVGVMAGIAFAANPTGKYDSAGAVNPSDSRAGPALEEWNRAVTFRRPKPAEPMSPTSCSSVEPVRERAGEFPEPYWVHQSTVSLFVSESGFGIVRMRVFRNARGVRVASRAIDRVELVSLPTNFEPSVYVLDEMATPILTRQAKRRPLDEFERLGLDAVRRGTYLVWTREAPTRMFGAIRADASCLACHTTAKAGDLLGAFTYYLNTPVDQLEKGKAAVKYREENWRGVWPIQPVMLKVAAASHREAKDWRTKCEVAQRFAESQTHLYEACARRWPAHHIDDEGQALVHFASAYFKRGPRQKEELITLLHSEDEELVGWLLKIINHAFEPDPNGVLQSYKPLGGAEIAHHIAGVYKTHPDLAGGVAQALKWYRADAKSEIPTLLRIVLSPGDDMTAFIATQAIGLIDENVYSQFGFDHLQFAEELTAEQRAAIEKYLALQGK